MFGNVIRLNPFGLVVLLGLVFFFIYMYMDSGVPPDHFENESVSLKRLLAVGIEVAEMGGREVQEVRRKGTDIKEKSKGRTKEGANDPLTDGDLNSHRVMTLALKNVFPNLRVISEEHDTVNPKESQIKMSVPSGLNPILDQMIKEDVKVPLRDITVWIDPLDATQEYTENLLQYVTTMVCIAVQGKPLIGIIHEPFANNTEWGWIGRGVSPHLAIATEPPTSPIIIVSRSHAGKVQEIAKKAFGEKVQVIPAGGAGYKCLEVIRGKASAYVHTTNIKKWDTCSGNVILVAAGGRMTTLDGDPIWYGPQEKVLNEQGVLGTLFHHAEFLEKLQGVKTSGGTKLKSDLLDSKTTKNINLNSTA